MDDEPTLRRALEELATRLERDVKMMMPSGGVVHINGPGFHAESFNGGVMAASEMAARRLREALALED